MGFEDLLKGMGKYNNIDNTNVKIKLEKFDDGVVLTINGDKRLGDMLAEVLLNVAKINGASSEMIEVIDNRADDYDRIQKEKTEADRS